MFAVHFMLAEIFSCDILERARSHMKGYFGDFDAFRFQVFQHLAVKMQTRRRCRNRAVVFCKNRLIRFFIFFVVGASDVWRQRNVPLLIHHLFEFHRGRFKAKNTSTIRINLFYMRFNARDFQFPSHRKRFAWTHPGFPSSISRFIGKKGLHQQNFNLPTMQCPSEKTRRNHFCIIDHNAIARTEKFDNPRRGNNFQRTFSIFGTMQNLRFSFSRRTTGNQFLGKIKSVIG